MNPLNKNKILEIDDDSEDVFEQYKKQKNSSHSFEDE